MGTVDPTQLTLQRGQLVAQQQAAASHVAEIEHQVQALMAQRDALQAQHDAAVAQRAALQSQFEIARRNHERTQRLFAQQAATSQQLDKAERDDRVLGLTTIVSTPYMDEATRCDRVALIHRGRLLGVDTPEAITRAFDRPLIGVRVKDRYKALLALRRYEQGHSVYPFGDTIHYTDKRHEPADRLAKDVVTFLASHGVTDATAAPIAPSVEDTFIARTAHE